MKKRTTRCLALLLAVVMVLSVMPVAMAEGTSQTYTKVTKAPEDWSGTYLIVSEGDKAAFDGSLKKLDAENDYKSVSITNGMISTSEAIAFTVAKMDGGYSIQAANGQYIYQTSDANGLKTGKTAKVNTIAMNADGSVNIVSGGAYLRFNASSNQMRFRYYKSATYTKQQPITLYKLDAAQAQVATPKASVADGADVAVDTPITFTCETADAKIYYTFGSSTEKQTYSASDPIKASTSGTYTVWAEKDGMKASEKLTFSVKVYRLVDKYVKTATIAADDQVLIYTAKAGGKVMTTQSHTYTNTNNNKSKDELVAAAASVADDVLTTQATNAALLTVAVDEDGNYTFKTSDNKYLYLDGTHVRLADAAGDYTLFKLETATGGSYIASTNAKFSGKVQYLEYFGGYFTCFGMGDDKTIYTFQFYKLTKDKDYIGGSDVPAEQVATPTASPAQGEVAKGTEVSFSCATEDAKIFYKTTGEYITYTKPIAVNENTTFTVKATKDGMTDSAEATFAYTVKTDAPAGLIADGTYVIYNAVKSKAMSATATGQYYRAGTTVSPVNGKVQNPSTDLLWNVKYSNGTYTITTQDGQKLSMNDDYNSLPLDEANTTWKIEKAKTDGCYYIISATRKGNSGDPYYVEWYEGTSKNGKPFAEFSTHFYSSAKEDIFAMQFLPAETVTPTPSEGLPQEGDEFVIYNQNAKGVLAAEGDSKTIEMAPAVIAEGKATPENGAVVFTVERNGDYYRFKSEAYGYLCSNGTGSNAFYSKNFSEEGVTTNDADWLVRTCSGGVDGFEMESRTAKYKGYSQWLEYFAGSFKSYSMDKSKVEDYTIYSFFFYPVADGVNVDGGLVVQPTITFPETMLPAYVGSNYEFDLEIDTIYAIDDPWIEYSIRDEKGKLIGGVMGGTDVEVLDGFTTGKGRVHITVFDTDIEEAAKAGSKMTLTFAFKDVKGNEARASYTVNILDEPVISNVTPAQGAQTGTEKKPVISAEIANAGEAPTVTMTVNNETVNASYADGKVTYTPAAALADGRVTVTVTVKRADGKEASKTWSFTIGEATFQRYFGQLHSHTQYSDGAGSLESALSYVKNLPDTANVDFVAFTDHSNYFDSTSAANPEGALYDMSLASASSQQTWKSYKDAVAAFNAENAGSMVAMAGFEMTWSGGPGHINTFNTPGIVSRNNSTLNNKTKDAGLQAYYKLLSQSEGANALSQFNHPGTTFGNFIDFGYWDAVIDTRMYMVEVGNGEGQIGAGGYYPSYEQYIMALDKGWHVAPTNNQDNHKGRWGNANDARDVVLTDDFTEDGIYEAIRNRRMYATEDKNLELDYTVNGNMMGSIIDVPEKLSFEVSFNDPDRTDSIAKVELVANSGKVAYTWDNAADLAKGSVSVTLDPEYTYYFVRVTEGDGDLAVTAPVWVGESLKLGISKAECGTSTPVTDEELTITTTFFNSEAKPATIKSITYAIGGEPIGTDTTGYTLAASSTQDVTFKYTPDKARIMTVRIMAVIEQDGKEYTFTKDVTLDVLDAGKLVYIGIDASHYNEYVAGNYKDSMGNFGELAAAYSVRTVTLKTSEELIAACKNSKYKALILTAPSRRLADAQTDPRTYSAAELEAIAAFNNAGGMVIVAGWSDNYENYDVIKNNPAIKHMAATQNEVLAKLGSSLRISDDATYDDVRSAADGVDKWRLYFSTYNMENPLLDGVEFDAEHPYDKLYTERFSHYGGASIYAVGADGDPTSTLPATVSPAVYGHATTYSVDVDEDGLGGKGTQKYAYAENDSRLMVMASEQIEGKGLIIVSGAAFMSNFEVQAKIEDSGAEKNYSNYRICENLVSMLNQTEITKIAAVQAEKDEGVKFTVEGIVTSNASGYDKDTAFFDCIYVQDDTAGINAFPVAGNFKIGDKVRVTGRTSSYQGERQLAVTKIEKIADAAAPAPKDVTAAQINNGSVLGSLVRIKGTITRVETAEGKIQTIMVKDTAGNEARVFIDGYITTAKEVQDAFVGYQVEAVGLASYDNTFVLSDGTQVYPRIRIRDRSDITCTKGGSTIDPPAPVIPVTPSKPGNTGTTGTTLRFDDVSRSDWFYDDVRYVYENGIMDGTGAYRFAPNAQLTRAMIVTILYRMDGSPAVSGASVFTDADSGMWYGKAVAWAAANGIVNGYGSGRFGPNDPVTREQLAAILYRYTAYRKASAASNGDNLASFSDLGTVSGYALESMNWAVGAGLLKGANGELDPKANATRAQVAAIIHRYLER